MKFIVTSQKEFTVEELKKLTQCIREIEQNNPKRHINVLMDTPEKKINEMEEIIKVKPNLPFQIILQNKCESCNINPVRIILAEEDIIYRLCHDCLFMLINLGLSQKCFNNLLKNGHSTEEYYMDSDFYEDFIKEEI